jgi:LmbE family N-acetylglucosaminyl deacetylase
MLSIPLPPNQREPLKLLCLGARSDDIEIGCGGTTLRLAAEVPQLTMRWVVFSSSDVREAEARDSTAAFLEDVAEKHAEVMGFRDGYFPFQGSDIKDRFEALKHEFEPSLVLTHFADDAHQDHLPLARFTYNTFRDHLMLEDEIPKYDRDIGNPNSFVSLTQAQLRRKVEALNRYFASQRSRRWFSDETFRALAWLRGIGCKATEGLAETFYARKIAI